LPGIALALQNRADDGHAADAADVGQHAGKLYVHLDQRLLNTLDGAARIRHQIASLPPQRACDPDLVGRLKAVIQQTEGGSFNSH
jgi:hypothetical protein